jgi:hypothetical protein
MTDDFFSSGYFSNRIEVYGCDGSYWYISGPDIPEDAGVTLNPRLTGAIDTPVKTLWLPGAFGQEAQGYRWERRDIVFAVQTFAQDPETWMTVDSEWRAAFDYVKTTRIAYTTSAGTRWLDVKMLEEPKSYEGETDGGRSPFLICDSTVVMTVAAELPFYIGETDIYEWELKDLTFGTTNIAINNDSDVPVWPRWTLTGGATWTLPDFSWGSEEYGRGVEDYGRMVEIPELSIYENVVVDSDPRKQTILSSNLSNVQGRWKGNDLLYPLLPGAKDSIPVSVKDVKDIATGVALRLEIPKWYTRPWSRPLP